MQQPPAAGAAMPPGDDAQDDAGIGSAASGYAGPENGPFECQNCVHFDGEGTCDNPQVQSDPEVQGKVEAEGCCNLFRPEEQGGGEENEPAGEDESIQAGGEQP